MAVLLVVMMLLGSTGTTGLVVPQAAKPAAAGSQAPAQRCAPSRPDRQSAALTARLCGDWVGVEEMKSETVEVFAKPDGSFAAQVHRAPVRVRRGDGWTPVDLALRRLPDGTITPGAHPYQLRLGPASTGAGPHQVVEMDLAGVRVGVAWSVALPVPVVDGSRVIYREVRPGVDLVLEPTRTGFRQLVEVKSRSAAAYVADLPVQLTGPATAFVPDGQGGLLLRDRAGTVVGRSPAAVMWDAVRSSETGGHVNEITVPSPSRSPTTERIKLLSTPDAKWLADATRTYPVTMETQVSAGTLFDTYVRQNDTVDRSGANDLQVGYGNGVVSRAFIRWDAAPFAGEQIIDATVYLWNWYSASCTASSWDIWTTDPTPAGVLWNSQPVWRYREAASTATLGFSTSCNDGWVTINARSFFQRAADSADPGPFMGIRATTESDVNSFKQFRSRNHTNTELVPYAVVTFNHKPVVSAVATGPPAPCATGADRPYINSSTPDLKATVTDADGSTVRARFQLANSSGALIGQYNYPGGFQASGSAFTARVPIFTLGEAGTYAWRSVGDDGLIEGPWSPWCEFTVDTIAPAAAPTVSSTAYPRNSWTDTPGRPGAFTFGPAGVADVAAYLYGLDTDLPTAAVNPAALGGSATVSLTPATVGPHTVYVRSRDRAGNLSPVSTYTFYVGTAALVAPVDGDTTVREIPLAAAAPSATGATFQYRRSDVDSWVDVPASNVRQRSDGTAVTWPVPMPGGMSPDLVWTATDTVSDNAMVQVRAVLSTAGDPLPTNAARLLIDRTASAAATETVGPGTVNLVTGDFRVADTDVALWGMSISRTTASRFPDALQGSQDQAFGPSWYLNYTSGNAGMNPAALRRPTDTTAEVITGTGTPVRFARTAATIWQPEPGAEELALSYDATTDRYRLVETTTGAYAFFARAAPGVSAYSVIATGTAAADSAITYTYEPATTSDGLPRARLRRIVAATTAVASSACAADPSVRGCRVLELVYAATTTANPSALGDYAGRVNAIRFWGTASGASAAGPIDVARYAYDQSGNLREVWDPRISPALKTAYTYDGARRVVGTTPPGELPWTFAYGTAGSLPTSGPGMLLSVRRPTLEPGTPARVNGTATTTMVYDVPATLAEGGPYELGTAEVQRWAQQTAPSTAVAIFPADAVPAGNIGRDALPRAAYARATVTYLDRNGRAVNVAEPGGQMSAAEHDRQGNTVRLLTAGNRGLAMGQGEDAAGQLATLGIASMPTTQRAAMLSTTASYTVDGVAKVEESGPLHIVAISQALPGNGGLPALPSGSSVAARMHTRHSLDQGRPSDGTAAVSHMVTRTAVGATVTGYGTDADTRVTATDYDWELGLPTRSIDDPDGVASTRTTAYDRQGRVVSVRTPTSNGADAGTTLTRYYTAGGTAPCGGRPEWTDMECTNGPAAEIGNGGDNPDELVTKTTTYTVVGDEATVTETANGVTRVTTFDYDTGGRETTRTVTGGEGTPVPPARTEYHPATGRITATVDSAGGRIAKEYDVLGRLIAYTDAAGARTTYRYDALDRQLSEADAAGTTTTYTYDTAAEPRGLPTATTDSVAGTFSSRYDADGTQTGQSLPGGVIEKTTVDQIGMPVAREYRTATGTPIMTDRIVPTIHGQWLRQFGLTTRAFTIDAWGRVTQTDDVSDDACVRRAYEYGSPAGKNTNRVAETTAVGAPGGDCPTTGGTTETHSYDTADRLVDNGYDYDAFGRTTALPGGLTVAYHADDRVRSQTAGTVRQTWNNDPAQRISSFTTDALIDGAWVRTKSKVNHYRGDSEQPDYIVEDTTTGELTRNVKGADGKLAATTSATGEMRLQLINLHGDVSVVYDPAALTALVYRTDEFGLPEPGFATDRYGYLGGHQRSREALGGTLLMGARVYDPGTGRFLQVDPIVGGNANAYDYCSGDPSSCVDVTGHGGCIFFRLICGYVRNYSGRTMHAAFLGSGSSWCQYRYFGFGGWGGLRCQLRTVANGRILGGNYGRRPGEPRLDVDAFTFRSTFYVFWGMYQPRDRYVKIPTGYVATCRWVFKPFCY